MKRKKRKLKIIYQSDWSTASPEQKREFTERLDRAYDLIFRKVVEREIDTKAELAKKLNSR